MGLAYVTGVVVYFFRSSLKKVVSRWSHPIGFIVLGIFFGLLTEFFAILDNLKRLPMDRILLDPDPMRDLFFGFFFYGLFIITWYFLLKRFHFSVKQVFLISGIFGILTEQFNPMAGGSVILLQAITNPFIGIPMAFLIACVYGIFPSLAYMLVEEKFQNTRYVGRFRLYGFALGSLLFQWAIYGNFILPILKRIPV